MTHILQLLVAAGIAIGLAIFALYRDKKEHRDVRQGSFYFGSREDEPDHEHRGAAMSRLP